MTEEIEELKNEKALLLNQVGCADDPGMAEVKQHATSMESSLEKLDQREKKYTAELEAAWTQYAELQHQAADVDAMELDAARQAARPDKEHEVIQKLQNTYGRRFESKVLSQSRKDIATLLDEITKPESIRQKLKQESQNKQHHLKTGTEVIMLL